jgi:hypothetical protein
MPGKNASFVKKLTNANGELSLSMLFAEEVEEAAPGGWAARNCPTNSIVTTTAVRL